MLPVAVNLVSRHPSSTNSDGRAKGTRPFSLTVCMAFKRAVAVYMCMPEWDEKLQIKGPGRRPLLCVTKRRVESFEGPETGNTESALRLILQSALRLA